MKIAIALSCMIVLAACDTAQYSSGASFLERHSSQLADASGSSTTVDRIAFAASVEPTLQFPARIGLARLTNGSLTVPTGEELQRFEAAFEELGNGIGDFVVISPLLAEMTEPAANRALAQSGRSNVIETIQLGAARQHVDAVLVYEIAARSNSDRNVLSLLDLTIIGAAILPSRGVEAVGTANALLIDTVSGYPYGNVTVSEELSTISTGFGTGDTRRNLADRVSVEVVDALVPELVTMFGELQTLSRQ